MSRTEPKIKHAIDCSFITGEGLMTKKALRVTAVVSVGLGLTHLLFVMGMESAIHHIEGGVAIAAIVFEIC